MKCPTEQCKNRASQMSKHLKKERWKCWRCGFEMPFSRDLENPSYIAYKEKRKLQNKLKVAMRRLRDGVNSEIL